MSILLRLALLLVRGSAIYQKVTSELHGEATWKFVQGWHLPDSLMDAPNTTVPSSVKREGIMFITQTGMPDLSRTIAMQKAWLSQVRSPDMAVHICDADCQVDQRLSSVVVYPSSLLSDCMDPTGQPCNGYWKSGLKLPFGLVHVYRTLVKRKQRLPKWWVLKDYDTYPIVDSLKQDLQARDPSKSLLLSQMGCGPACGAAGVILSWSLAEAIASKHGDEYINRTVMNIKKGFFYWDANILWAKEWIPSTMLVDDVNMNGYGPRDAECLTGKQNAVNGAVSSKCFKTPNCLCTRSPFPATFHIKTDFYASLALLENSFQSSLSQAAGVARAAVDPHGNLHNVINSYPNFSQTSLMRRGEEGAVQRSAAVSHADDTELPIRSNPETLLLAQRRLGLAQAHHSELTNSRVQESVRSTAVSILMYQGNPPRFSWGACYLLIAFALFIVVYLAYAGVTKHSGIIRTRSTDQRDTDAQVLAKAEDLPPLSTVAKAVTWMVSSVMLTIFNKWIMIPTGLGFPFPITLSLAHMLIGSVLLFSLCKFKPSMFPAIWAEGSFTLAVYRTQIPGLVLVGMLFAVSISTSNCAYMFLQVSSINLLKCGNPLIAFLVSSVLTMPERNRGRRMIGCLVFMFVGCVLTVQGSTDGVHKWLGFSILGASIFVEQFRLCIFKGLVSSTIGGCDPLSTLLILQPVSFVTLLVPAMLLEFPRIVQISVFADSRVPVILFLNAVLSVVLNISFARLLQSVTNTTFAVWGVLKDLILSLVALSALGGSTSIEQMIGYLLLVASFFGYSWLKSV